MTERAFSLALCNEVVRELDFAAQCDLAATLGYDALEVAPFTLTDDPRRLGTARLEAWRKTAEGAGLRIASLHWLLMTPAGLSITSADPAVRRETLAVMESLVEMCAALGGEVLVHGSPKQRVVDPEDPAGSRERALEAFAAAAGFAEAAGVTYCIEPLSASETAYVNTVAEAAAVVAEVGSPALRTMLDTRAARLTETEPVEAVLRAGIESGVIAHVHLNDSSGVAPGQGEDPFEPVIGALLGAGYTGVAAVEPFEYLPDGPGAAAFAAGYVRGLVEALAPRRTP